MVSLFKTVCDILLYFTFISFLPAFDSAWLLLGVLLVTGSVAAFINDRLNNTVGKIISALLVLPGLFLVGEGQLFFVVILVGYLFITMITGNNDISYQQYRYYFGLPAVVVLAALFVCITSSLENKLPLLFGSLYLLIGTIVLRRKRMGVKADGKAALYNGIEIISVVFVTAAVFGLLFVIISHSRGIFEIVTLPIGMVIRGLIAILVFLGRIVVKAQPDEKIDSNPQSADEIYNEIFNPEENVIDNVDNTNVNIINLLQRIILIVLAIAIIVLVLYLLYKLVRNFIRNNDNEEYEDATGVEAVKRKKKKKVREDLSNRQQIRKIYRDFLFSANRKGVPVEKQTTSEDILNNELYVNNADAIKLREIYIKARYQTDSLVTEEDIRMAREAEERLAQL
ncbi:MAG: hypothetical protein IJ115_03340 [Erysipelotrichaceae bacterium]|nr:hypothetical protein [Erysipelotrichaceae bacterium]